MHTLSVTISCVLLCASLFYLAPLSPGPDCAMWLADSVSIVPYDARHLYSAHTFITLDGDMLRNAYFPQELKDACTKALHKHLNGEVGLEAAGAARSVTAKYGR